MSEPCLSCPYGDECRVTGCGKSSADRETPSPTGGLPEWIVTDADFDMTVTHTNAGTDGMGNVSGGLIDQNGKCVSFVMSPSVARDFISALLSGLATAEGVPAIEGHPDGTLRTVDRM